MSKTFSLEQIEAANEEYGGFCVECGEEHWGIEPDARGYKCENCGKDSVYGAEEIAIMGLVK
jgi:DNA-directed RNA polymerase subunit RPC12/RpoP